MLHEYTLPQASLAATLPAPTESEAAARTWRILVVETRCEFLKLLRTPHYSLPTLVLPVMFYLLFGLTFTGRSKGIGVGPAEYLLAGYTVFGAVTAALFAFGAGVAVERAQGWLVLKRATPMPVSAYLGAKVVSCMAFGALIVLVMAACGIVLGGVRLPFGAWLSLLALATLGCVPFCLLGLSIAFVVPPASASGIVNLINLPLAFASGMWVPVNMLPRVFQAIAPVLPQYHISQLAIGAIGTPPVAGAWWHACMLFAAALVFGAAAWAAWRRSDATQR